MIIRILSIPMLLMLMISSTYSNDKESTIKFFNSAIEILDKSKDTKDLVLLLLAHKTIINIYSKDGEIDKATPHLIAYAINRPDDFNDPRKPLYITFLNLPLNVKGRGKSHHATVNFDVDENGFTKNITPLPTINMELSEALINAVKTYRYAPAIKDGKPVSMHNLNESVTIFTER